MSHQKTPDKPLDPHERVVTDAVHERFLLPVIFCEDCKVTLQGNNSNIAKHFNKSHVSDNSCIYCKGKVFRYTELNRDQETKSREFVYHNCRDWSKS